MPMEAGQPGAGPPAGLVRDSRGGATKGFRDLLQVLEDFGEHEMMAEMWRRHG
jgi:hypothetical protein